METPSSSQSSRGDEAPHVYMPYTWEEQRHLLSTDATRGQEQRAAVEPQATERSPLSSWLRGNKLLSAWVTLRDCRRCQCHWGNLGPSSPGVNLKRPTASPHTQAPLCQGQSHPFARSRPSPGLLGAAVRHSLSPDHSQPCICLGTEELPHSLLFTEPGLGPEEQPVERRWCCRGGFSMD